MPLVSKAAGTRQQADLPLAQYNNRVTQKICRPRSMLCLFAPRDLCVTAASMHSCATGLQMLRCCPTTIICAFPAPPVALQQSQESPSNLWPPCEAECSTSAGLLIWRHTSAGPAVQPFPKHIHSNECKPGSIVGSTLKDTDISASHIYIDENIEMTAVASRQLISRGGSSICDVLGSVFIQHT